MATKQPRILFIFAKHGSDTSTRFGGFIKRIKKNGGFKYADVDYVALEDLLFQVKGPGKARVFDPVRKIDLKDFNFVYFKSWQSMPELASAAARYLEAMGIPYADYQARQSLTTKTTNYMAHWAQGISVPATTWGSNTALLAYIKRIRLTYPLIIKASDGEKGKDNFLVHTRKEAVEVMKNAQVDMLLQQFIPNDGDYRIGVYGNRARWAIFRRSGGTSHLNNTSAGGVAEFIEINDLDPAIIKLAEQACAASELAIAGVDVVQDKHTKELYVFEANQGSQIVTGVFTESNMKAFDEGIKAMVVHNDLRSRRTARQFIGRDTKVDILNSDEQLFSVYAKVDTGAYQSSIHAEKIELRTDEKGREYVYYALKDPHNNVVHEIKTYEFWRALIKNSFGEEQERFVVPMSLRILGVQYETRVSLADRTTQKYLLLIGRKLLQGNFIVNVELSELGEEL